MSKNIIAVDVDEVLTHHNKSLLKWHNENFKTNHTLDDYISEEWSKIWGLPKEEGHQRALLFHETGLHRDMEVIAGAAEALKQLSAQHDLVVVTARLGVIKEVTHEWLERFFPDTFEDIHFVPYWETKRKVTKAEVCKQIGAQFLIDDSVDHCTTASDQGLQSLLFGTYPWNIAKHVPKKVIRVKDWQEVVDYFSK